jgi:predicted exporter
VSVTRQHKIGLVAGVALLVLLSIFCVARFRVTTAITHFVSAGDDVRMAEIARLVADSELTRTMVLSIEGPDTRTALSAAARLADLIRDHPEVEWLRERVEPGFDEAVYELYFPRRFMFVSDTPEEDIPSMLSDEGLASMARELKHELSLPTGVATKRLAPQDPWLLFNKRLEELESARVGSVRIENGQFVSADGLHAIVFLATRHSAFDSTRQAPLDEAIADAFDTVAQEHEGVRIERSSVHRFALRSERAIRADIQRISLISIAGIIVLFVVVYRSLRLMLLAFLPLASGMIVATAVGLAVFGELHGLTLAFGATMIGVCIDYPVHYFTHHSLAPDGSGPMGTLRRVWVGLLLGALTTVAGFVGLAWTSFPGIREIGVFGSVGIASALVTTRVLLPPLLPAQPRPVRLQQRLERALSGVLDRARHRRGWLIGLLAAGLLLCGLGLPRLTWVDDAVAFNSLEPGMLEEDRRVRERVSRVDTGRLVIAVGSTEEEALARNDAAHRRLQGAKSEGVVEYTSIHPLLFSAKLQLKNLEVVRESANLEARMLDALAAEGFRKEAFEGLGDGLSEAPTPLAFDDLLASSLASVARPFRITFGDEVAFLTFLRDVEDPTVLADRLAGLDGVYNWDQRAFLANAYAKYRQRVTALLLLGLLAVGAILLARYRSPRLTAAAFLPALLAAGGSLSVMALLGLEAHIFHLMGLLMVLSIGVDYGVFLAESMRYEEGASATLLSLVIACLSTVFAFGLLGLSSNPALQSVGWTTGIGVLLSLVLAPTALVLVRGAERRAQ